MRMYCAHGPLNGPAFVRVKQPRSTPPSSSPLYPLSRQTTIPSSSQRIEYRYGLHIEAKRSRLQRWTGERSGDQDTKNRSRATINLHTIIKLSLLLVSSCFAPAPLPSSRCRLAGGRSVGFVGGLSFVVRPGYARPGKTLHGVFQLL